MSRYPELTKRFKALAGNRHLVQLFHDFVETFAISLRNAVDRHEWQEREDRYLEVTKNYSSDQLAGMAEAFALIVQEMTESPADVLGRLYMELEISSEHMGQFFTPYDIAKLLAAMQSPGLVDHINTHGKGSLYEPACGAGAFLIATCDELRRQDINYQQQLLIVAEDLSIVSVHMAYIHLTLLHVPAVVYHRNTLTLETFSAWPTPAYLMHGWRLERDGQQTAPVPPPEPVVPADAITSPTQDTLFDLEAS